MTSEHPARVTSTQKIFKATRKVWSCAKGRAVEQRVDGRDHPMWITAADIDGMTAFVGRSRIARLSRARRECHLPSAAQPAGMRVATLGAAPPRMRVRPFVTPARLMADTFNFLSVLFHPKSDSRRSHFWTILFCTGRRSDAASAARRARRLPDDAAPKVARQPRASQRKAFLFPATQRSESRRGR
ncbi:hypothetical protein [Burkholderia sp. IMCC1007]|uniref:hypothetical protein n=1 Tax=Burkholderia sp. IMCC1007 TaxID=3004104 RepID=UPI0022B413E0|nr:hypothetical protein [Burkholderia sp. IMCC1007]